MLFPLFKVTVSLTYEFDSLGLSPQTSCCRAGSTLYWELCSPHYQETEARITKAKGVGDYSIYQVRTTCVGASCVNLGDRTIDDIWHTLAGVSHEHGNCDINNVTLLIVV